MTGVGHAMKFKKLTPLFIDWYQITQQTGCVSYRVVLPSFLSNMNDIFHVSHLKKYILDSSYIIQVNDMQVRDNLTVEASFMRTEDQEVKQLMGKEFALVKVV